MLSTSGTLLISTVFSAASGFLCFYVAAVVGSRPVEGAGGMARRAFAIWWQGLATYSLLTGVITLLAATGRLDVALLSTLTLASLLVLCLALWGLLYYLLYLFTGMSQLFLPTLLFYVANYAGLVYLTISSQPSSILVQRWGVVLEGRVEPAGFFGLVFLVLLIAPQIVGSLAYLTLVRKTQDPELRYRITVVSVSIFLWFAGELVARLVHVEATDAWNWTNRILSIVAPAVIILAYRPPRSIRRRWTTSAQGKGASV